MPTLVNVGCGSVAHPDWLNFDVAPRLAHVQRLDVRRGLPLADGQAHAVYSSHVLEHLTSDEAEGFLREMRRVLTPGGVIRLVVPDLEQICRLYLGQLQGLRDGSVDSDFAYRFSLLELLDQSVRDRSGGEMIGAYRAATGRAAQHVLQRHGAEAEPYVGLAPPPSLPEQAGRRRRRPLEMLHALRWRALLLGTRALGGPSAPGWLSVGRFRSSGEVHRVMYDAYSLAALLGQHGFVDPHAVDADASDIPRFASYELDRANGHVRKPDSLFFEARKPL